MKIRRDEERRTLERKIIACLLMDYDWLIDLLDIPSECFTGDNKEVITAMRKAGTGDATILASNCPRVSQEEIRDIATETLWISEFEKYISQLKDLISRDKLSASLRKIVTEIWDWKELNDIYSDLNKLKIDVEENSDLSTALFEIVQEIDWTKEVKIIPTWYRDLDNLIWWFEPWQVIVIGARPWVWKSMFAINMISKNIQAWEKVALFSLEMKNKQVLRRLLAMNSWVWVWKLKKKVEWENLTKVQEWFSRLTNQLENFSCVDDLHNIWEVERKIRFLVNKKWVSVVYLDYLQLIKNPDYSNQIEWLTDMSQRLKQLALNLNITIVELSQLNRESDKSAVKKASQLRWSWSIEQDADMVRILDKQDEDSNRIQISVQKCRDWRIWDIDLQQVSDIMMIQDLPLKPF